MNDYEILLMLDADLDEARHNEIISRTRDLVEKSGGTWVGHDPWGRRKLAFEIDKKTDGVYHLLQFDADPATLDELTRILKITDGVMRHLATRRIESAHGPGRPGPEPTFDPSSADRTPDYAVANTRSQSPSENGAASMEASDIAASNIESQAPSIEAPSIEAPSIEEEEA